MMRAARAMAATGIIGLALAGAALAQTGGQVTMMLTGGVDRPLDRIVMPLENAGDPAIKVALAEVTIADGAMTAKLTTKIGLLQFEADAPTASGDQPTVRSATFFDNAGAQYAMGAGGAQLTIEDYAPGVSIRFTFASGMEGLNGAPPAGVSVSAATPVRP